MLLYCDASSTFNLRSCVHATQELGVKGDLTMFDYNISVFLKIFVNYNVLPRYIASSRQTISINKKVVENLRSFIIKSCPNRNYSPWVC